MYVGNASLERWRNCSVGACRALAAFRAVHRDVDIVATRSRQLQRSAGGQSRNAAPSRHPAGDLFIIRRDGIAERADLRLEVIEVMKRCAQVIDQLLALLAAHLDERGARPDRHRAVRRAIGERPMRGNRIAYGLVRDARWTRRSGEEHSTDARLAARRRILVARDHLERRAPSGITIL